jgi:isopenicillin-N N-acyltransferase like protein
VGDCSREPVRVTAAAGWGGTTFPSIRVEGDAYERGRQYGTQARDLVQRCIELYAEIFRHHTSLTWAEVVNHAGRFEDPIGIAHPSFLEEMRGIGAGAGVGAEDILALNARTEIMFATIAKRMAAECTSLALLPDATADHSVIVAQNWDWRPALSEVVVVLECAPSDGPSFVTVVEAGLLAKAGMNSAGLGIATNALITDNDRGDVGLPYHVVLRALLSARSLPEAIAAVTGHVRASSANYLVAHRSGVAVDVEAAPGDATQAWQAEAHEGRLVHANHFVHGGGDARDVTLWYMPDSPHRLDRIKVLLDPAVADITVADIQHAFSDHRHAPVGVCKHGDDARPLAERSTTIASLIMNLSSSELTVADGKPCERPYRTSDYAGFFARSSQDQAGRVSG